jgi:prepilin signal peptidase PulO-like enzyme (type II secretory pathway)
MLPALGGAFGAGLFGLAGWLGWVLATAWYGTLERETDGPPAGAIPAWAFVAVPACLGAIVGVRGAPPLQVALLIVAVIALTVCTATDVRTGMIPDAFTLGPLIVVLAVALLERAWMPLFGALFAFVPFAIIAAVSRGRGMGWGDVKLAAFGGALVGMGGITLAVAMASLAACIVARSVTVLAGRSHLVRISPRRSE